MTIELLDVIVIVAYFASVLTVGLKFGERENTLESLALGGRAIPWWAVLASIIAAETSAATFLGTPGEGFQLFNYTFLQLILGTIIGRCIVAFVFIKPFYDNNVFSIYEYLQIRFGHGTRQVASAIFLLTRLLASGARLYVAAIVLAVGYRVWTGQPASEDTQLLIYICSIVLLTIVTAVYTSFGGIKAVVWTDCIQATVMIGGAIAAIALLIASISQTEEGRQLLLTTAHTKSVLPIVTAITPGESWQTNLVRIFNTDYTIWAGILGMSFTALATHGTDQDMVQRMLTAESYKKSRLSLILSGLADFPIGFIFLTIGILLHIFYQVYHDPSAPAKGNEIFVYYMLKNLPTGLRGLLIAGIFATSMGSLSAALNALATSFTRDWYHEKNEKESVAMLRLSTYGFALLMIVVASATAFFVIKNPDSRIIPIVLGIFGYTYGSLLGVFLLGLCTRNRGTDVGNYLGMLSGFLIVALFTGLPNQLLTLLGQPQIKALGDIPLIAFPWRIMLGALVTMAIASLFRSRGQTLGSTSAPIHIT